MSCFIKDPKDRPSSNELINHPWISGEEYSSDEVQNQEISDDDDFYTPEEQLKNTKLKKDIRRISIYNTLSFDSGNLKLPK